MQIRRIEEVLNFRTLVLDDGERVTLPLRSIDGVVATAGYFLIQFDVEGHTRELLFSADRVAAVRPVLTLANGRYIQASELWYGNPPANVGDYVVRMTDGYHIVQEDVYRKRERFLLVLVGAHLSERSAPKVNAGT
jgi:hypothetical protein